MATVQTIIAVDPGPRQSAYVELRGSTFPPALATCGHLDNPELLELLRGVGAGGIFVCEKVVCYGRIVGEDVYETAFAGGRFTEAVVRAGLTAYRLSNPVWRRALVGIGRVEGAGIRQAILDLYPPTGGGAEPRVGTKGKPGPLFAMRGDHIRDATGVGLGLLKLGDEKEAYRVRW